MIANKLVLPFVVAMGMVAGNVSAVQGLDASGNKKVDRALAKRWSAESGAQDGYQKLDKDRVVNIGSKRQGTCNVNVGGVQKGQKAPREIVVTTKDVVNVCK